MHGMEIMIVELFGRGRMISTGSSSQMTNDKNSTYMKWLFPIGYFEKYVNLKSDYLVPSLSVQ